MSINETQYKIDIESFQRALRMIHSTPAARLEIEPHRATLTISGEYAWVVHGAKEIATVLDQTGDRFYENFNDDEPVEPVLDKSVSPSQQIRQFVVIVESNGVCDYIHDAAYGHQVNPSTVEAVLADYRRDDCFTLVFSLDGQSPFILPNSAKPAKDSLSEDIPFTCKDATGRIYQEPDGWGGEFTLGTIQIRLKAKFVGPETVQQELEFIVNICNNFIIGNE
jgi:hypothetical protein